MAEAMNIRFDRILSSKVTPVMTAETLTETISEEHVISVLESTSPIDDAGDEFSGERNPHDRWLPITESRNGGTLRAVFHLLCSGIGYQALLLPIAFISLGWSWGIICLSLAFSWQLYTTWLLVNLHEPSPQTGIRCSRYLHLLIVAFGEKMAKLLGLFPTMYLSTGTCIVFIITGGNVMELLFETICGDDLDCKAKTLTGAQWFLLFMCIAVFAAQFFPNLNSLAVVSAIGSITAVSCCFLLWIMSVDKGQVREKTDGDDDGSGFRDVLNGFAIIAAAFRGHNLVLEIQGTIPTNRKKRSRVSMWRGVIISYLLIAMCMYPIAIVGHWAYENKVYPNLGILTSFIKFHQKSTSKFVTGAICLTAIIHYLCAYQIYAMPALDNFERIYVTKKNKPCPRWVRSGIKVLFGGFTYFVSVALPFLPSLGLFIGSLVFPLTLVYPCMMWVAVKKPVRFSLMWCINVGLGFLGIVFCGVCAGGALWSLIVDGLDANFFKPK